MQTDNAQTTTASRIRFCLARFGRTLLVACLLLASGQSQGNAETYGTQGGYSSGPAPLYGASGNSQPAYGQQQNPNMYPGYGQQPYSNLPPNYGQLPYQYQQQGTVNGTPGYAGTWQDPANGDTVTTIIAPRAPQQQMPQIIGAPGNYYDGYYNNQQEQHYQNQNYWEHGQGVYGPNHAPNRGQHGWQDMPGRPDHGFVHPGHPQGGVPANPGQHGRPQAEMPTRPGQLGRPQAGMPVNPGQHGGQQAGMHARPLPGGIPGAIGGQMPHRPPMPANPGPGGAGGIRR